MLNKDQIKLLRLLADAYNFSNQADTNKNDTWIDKGNYIDINHSNELDCKLVSSVCNPLSRAMTSIIGSEKVYTNWINGSNHDVDALIKHYDDIINQD